MVITIPRKLVEKDDLVILPRREYEEFSRWKRAVRVRLDEQWFWTPGWQRKEAEADEAINAGKVSGPFADHTSLIRALNKALKFLSANLSHPSLNIRKLPGTSIWYGRASREYRFTFQLEEGTIILRRVGTHDILDKERKV